MISIEDKRQLAKIFTLTLERDPLAVIKVVVISHPDLILPSNIFGGMTVTLDYGLNMPIQIPDLKIDDRGVSATLSFNRVPCTTFVPWESVVGFGPDFANSPAPAPAPKRQKPKLTLVP